MSSSSYLAINLQLVGEDVPKMIILQSLAAISPIMVSYLALQACGVESRIIVRTVVHAVPACS